MQKITARCCIVGGGPAGVMLGYLLARAGIDVVVMEKWPDFFRDFRGDTIHPSTMENLHELGILDEFLKLKHQKTRRMVGHIGGEEVTLADFSYLKAREPYIAFIPQWDFLNFLSAEARRYPHFKLLMHTEMIHLISEDNRIVGVTGQGPQGPVEIRADLVIGADGRHSAVRAQSGLKSSTTGVGIDVLWFRLSARESDPEQSFGYIDEGKVLITLDRGDYWQCGFLIAKGSFEDLKAAGLDKFRMTIARLAPHLSQSVSEINDWEKIKLLSVTIDHMEKWHKPGLLLIGDAAHAMSPIGGVGINLAIQDAVAAANMLVPAFRNGAPTETECAAIQERRRFPTRLTQRVQIFLQNKFFVPYLRAGGQMQMPRVLRLFQKFPFLRSIPAKFVGQGVQPEHIREDLFS